ncbi:MAG: thiamine phosphate synthase [Granulosicoccus sp.]
MLSRFYLIVDNTESLERFLPLGLECVQLRIKDASPPDLKFAVREAKELCDAYRCQLIINDYWKLAIEEGCDAIHLGQEDLDAADMLAIQAAELQYGISTHDRKELRRAMELKPNYIALGPIYQTLLKKMPWRPQGLEKLTRWKTMVGDIPLVAIGGLNPERAQGVFESGADSICVVTDVQQHENPANRVRQWLELCADLD